ncbi:MAG: TonB-dependent receptor, partial [Bacteroidia bacterium]|nr:TonB-dependent receptor [Bacteroidia bacterium]
MNKFYVSVLSIFLLLAASTMYAQKGTVKGVVKSGAELLPGATVIVSGTQTGTTTNIDGEYSLNLAPGKQTIEARYIGFETVTKEVNVASGQTVSLDFELSRGLGLTEVVIIGSRGAPRTKLETMVPVDVIGVKELETTAQADLSQILQYVAPSFHSTPQTISDGTDHIDPAALRGLGPDQTLVLINGKRRHTSALLNVNGTVGRGSVGTDLNAIPAAAIKRIEILRDGAAAQYGSDAIAGVINIVLKENTNLVSFDVQTGVTAPNAFDGPGNAAGSVPDSLIPDFNADGEMYQIASNFGFDVGDEGGFVNVTLSYTDRASTNRSGNYTGSIYPAGYDDALSSADFFSLVQDETGFADQQVMEIGNSAIRNAGAYLNTSYPLSNNAELYGMLGFNYKNGIARGFYRFPSSQDRVVPQLYPHGFSPQIHSDITDNSFIVGARGMIGEWHADMSQTRGSNEFQFNIRNSVNASLGQASPTQAYAGGFSYGQNTSNVDFSRTFDIGVPVNVGFGGEFRLENYQIFEGEEASYIGGGVSNIWPIGGSTDTVAGAAGIQVFPGFQPQNALDKNRNSVGFYGDFEFDLTDELMLGLAGRYEDYSD